MRVAEISFSQIDLWPRQESPPDQFIRAGNLDLELRKLLYYPQQFRLRSI